MASPSEAPARDPIVLPATDSVSLSGADLAILSAALVESSTDAIVAKALDGTILSWNRGAEQVFGYAAEEIVGRPITVLAPAERTDEMPGILASIKRGERVEHYETERLHKDGRRLHVSLSVSPIRNAEGEIVGAAKIARDITARKLAEAELAEKNRALATANAELQNARLAIEIERRRWQELFELAPDGYLVTDLAGNVREANRAAGEQLGASPKELLGRPLASYVAATRRRSFRVRLARLATEHGTQSWEVPLAPRARPPFDAALAVTVIRDTAGEPSGLRWLLRDVTERKAAERERAFLLASEQAERTRAEAAEQRAAFLAEASGLLAASLDVEPTLASLARLAVPDLADYCQIYEQDESGALRQVAASHRDPELEPTLRRLGELYRGDPRNPGSPIGAALQSGRSLLLPRLTAEDTRAALPPGELLDVALRLGLRSALVVPLAARGNVLGVLALAMSESGRCYGEADLALAEELARRAALAIANARLYREVREASAAKDRFLATLSHELRTPLTPVLALVSALQGDARLPADVAQAITRIRRNVELEARLIDDLLDLTRVARGKLELKREVADLSQILTHAIETSCAGRPPGTQAEVGADSAAGDHRLWGDAPRLTQVFWNLLHNACKFTPAEGRIRVRTRREVDPEGRPFLVVEVADTGIGIEAALLPTVFDAFEQGQRGISRRFGGLGLGLAVSKAIVELHGGTLAAASAGSGQGATFTVRLPVGELPSAGAPAATAGAGPAAAGERALHILLVEDHLDTAEVMAELLRTVGHRVTAASGVGEALAAAQAAFDSSPGGASGLALDLVVSDLGLPDGSGLDLMRELAGRFALRGIALSGYGMDEDVARSHEAGFIRHLTKPIDLQSLLAAIRESAG